MPDNSVLSALVKARSIGPEVPQTQSVPMRDQNNPLTAQSIPELLARYGLDPTDLGNIGAGSAHAASVVGQAPESLIRALGPLLSGGLERGRELAQSLPKDLVGAKQAMPRNPAALALIKQLQTPIQPPNYAKLAAMEQVTGLRPAKAPMISAPEGFQFNMPRRGLVQNMAAARPEQLKDLDQIWTAVESQTRKAPNKSMEPMSSRFKDRPPLSGRWNKGNGNRSQVQQKLLSRNYEKP